MVPHGNNVCIYGLNAFSLKTYNKVKKYNHKNPSLLDDSTENNEEGQEW